MQKKKKVSKATAKKKTATKTVAKKTTAKKAVKKVEKAAAPKKPAPKPAIKKAPAKAKAKTKRSKKEPPKLSNKPIATIQNPETNAPITREEFKNMNPDAQEHYKRWLKLNKQLAEEAPQDYRMTEDYEIKTPLQHKVHGWGVVMQKRDNYIDVIFEAGIKTLIVNYKP